MGGVSCSALFGLLITSLHLVFWLVVLGCQQYIVYSA